MADIDVERKSSHGLLWAILGIAALGLLLFWLLRGSGAERITMVEEEPAAETATQPTAPVQPPAPMTSPAVQQYQQACGQPQTGTQLPEAQYTSTCIELLIAALESSVGADQTAPVHAQIDSARTSASQLRTEQDPNAQARLAQEALSALAGAFRSIGGGASIAAVERLSTTASELNPDQPLSAQTATVHRFFAEAGSLLATNPSAMGV